MGTRGNTKENTKEGMDSECNELEGRYISLQK